MFEKENGREAKDVSRDYLGYDIESADASKGEKRYIEVKARAQSGPVALTQNEWFKAKRFGEDYYLYVVYTAATTAELHVVRDPARNWSRHTILRRRFREFPRRPGEA